MTEHVETSVQRATSAPEPYEAPRVEKVLTPEDLEREVIYAGEPSTSD